ncbi:MAG TPA: hypothetical protein VFZ61_12075 [Polyangiales bacterium]
MGYAARSDGQARLAVWCIRGAVSATEWAAHLRDMEQVRRWGTSGPRPCVLLQLLDNSFVPNAAQRRDIAEHSAGVDYRPNLAVVTTNPVVRGVIQALGWLQTQQRSYQLHPFATAGDAMAWLEKERGHTLPALRALLEEAHAALSAGRPLAAPPR